MEEKKTDVDGEVRGEERGEVRGDAGDVRSDPLPGVQAAILSHGARVATLAAARARGGIYTARPWQGRESDETESENEDIIESLQVREQISITRKCNHHLPSPGNHPLPELPPEEPARGGGRVPAW